MMFTPTRYWFFKVKDSRLVAYGYDFDNSVHYWFIDDCDMLRMQGECKTQSEAIHTAKRECERMISKRYLDFAAYQKKRFHK